MMVGVAGFEPATPASRTQCSTGLSYSPRISPYGQGGIRTHEGFTPTRFPIVLLKPLGHLSSGLQRRGWDSNPREPFGPDGLANRCRNHLATSPNPLDDGSEAAFERIAPPGIEPGLF